MRSIPTTGVPSNYRSCIQLQEFHSYYRSCIQLQEFHQMRTQSRNPRVNQIGLAEGQTEKGKTGTQLQDRHPTTRQTPNYKTDTQVQEFQSYYRSSFPTTGVASNYKSSNPTTGVAANYKSSNPTTGVASNYRSSNPTTGVPSYYRSSFQLQEFQSYYRSSIPNTGAPIPLQEFRPTYKSEIQPISQRSNL